MAKKRGTATPVRAILLMLQAGVVFVLPRPKGGHAAVAATMVALLLDGFRRWVRLRQLRFLATLVRA